MTEPTTCNRATPWYLHLVQAFAAWLAAIFMLAFVASIFDFNFDSTLLLALSGAVLLVVAAVLQKQNTEVFANHMALAFVLCGQWLIFISLHKALTDYPAVFFGFWALLQGLLLWLFKEQLTRFVLSLFLIQTLLINANLYGIGALVYWLLLAFCSWAYLTKIHSDKATQLLTTLGLAGLVFLLMQSFSLAMLDGLLEYWYPKPLVGWVLWPWLNHVFFGLWLLFFIGVLFSVGNLKQHTIAKVLALVVVLVLALLHYFLPQAVLAVVILLLAFAQSNRVLQALAIGTLLFFVSQYYYYLPETLLAKSWALLQVALVLLALGAILKMFEKREVSHEKS